MSGSLSTTVFNQSVTFTALVKASLGIPTGTVTFKDGATALSTVTLVAGKAVLSVSTLSVGVHSITVVYNGSVDYASSTSAAVSHTVNKAATTTALVSSLNPSTSGTSVTLTATVKPATSGVPTGSVTFKDGSVTLGSGTLSAGKATLSTSTLSRGSYSLTAVYSGSVDYLTSTSPVLSQVVY